MPSAPETTITLPNPLPAHPRLLVTKDDWQRLRRQVVEDPASARIYSTLRKKADALLTMPPVERTMKGYRLLAISRTALERISLLSMVACIDGDKRYARRAIAEMLQVADFKDWNPSHYLDTAEMALGVAIGYDWLFDELSDEERDRLSSVLDEKGIAPSLKEPEQWFIHGDNNWNQVCHAGISAAAIAIADLKPELCRAILQRAIKNLPRAADAYAPDGAYLEGPMYWNYGTLFHTVFADSLRRFLGTTCGVDAYDGFTESAEYIAQVTSPAGYFYPYADARKTRHLLIPLFWFARRCNRPDWLEADLNQLDQYMELYESLNFDDSNYRLLALALLWRDPAVPSTQHAVRRLHWLGKGRMPVAVHRSAFNDPDALFAAIKGGSPSMNHAHMDAGSFMIQAEGIVWALDPGMQEYESLESLGINLWDGRQGGRRWQIFRLGPEGHNIPRIDDELQDIRGNAQFVRFQPDGATPHSVLDLAPLYPQAARFHRGMMFLENRAVLLQDEWQAGDEPIQVAWQMLTTAKVQVESHRITLSQGGKQLTLHLPDSTERDIQVLETASIQKPYDAPNPDMRRIDITMKTEAGKGGLLRVVAIPGNAGDLAIPAVAPLLSWSAPPDGSPHETAPDKPADNEIGP